MAIGFVNMEVVRPGEVVSVEWWAWTSAWSGLGENGRPRIGEHEYRQLKCFG